MRTRVWQALVLGAILAMPVFKAQAEPGNNVLLIMAHDVSTALGAYGNAAVPTPNLDRLASMGVRFQSAHTNYALCNPSRTSLLSGVYPESSKVYKNTTPPRKYLGSAWVMLQDHFRNNGYLTGRIGIVPHGTWDSQYRWDINVKSAPGTPPPPYTVVDSGGVNELVWEATTEDDEDTWDRRNARYASRVIERLAARPFFIAVGFKQTHWPWKIPQRYFDMIEPSLIRLPLERGEPPNDRDDIPPRALTAFTDWSDLGSDENRRKLIRAVYASHAFFDSNVGVLLDTLTRLDLWKKTIVVLVADHGFHYGEHGGLTRKETLFSEATRVPLIIAAPGKAANQAARAPVDLVDLYPTLSALAGLPIRPENEGISLVPLLDNPASVGRRPAYSVVGGSTRVAGRSIVTPRFRYTEWATTPPTGELYDQALDPGEYRNLFADPAYQGVVTRMKGFMAAARARPRLK
jgi:arylsulfatase A-like enzyme